MTETGLQSPEYLLSVLLEEEFVTPVLRVLLALRLPSVMYMICPEYLLSSV